MKRQSKINQDVQWVKNQIVKVPRSTFYMRQDWQGTYNAGELVPFHNVDVLPGDTMSLRYSNITRTVSTMIKPVMGTMELVMYAFFIPFRITWANFDTFISGYQENPDWTTDVNLVVPQCAVYKAADVGDARGQVYAVGAHTVADYLGLPVGVIPDSSITSSSAAIAAGASVSKLYFSGYSLIWNNWFRDEATQKSVSVATSDSGTYISMYTPANSTTPIVYPDLDITALYNVSYSCARGGKLAPLNKKRDLFTSALPNAQKGAPVSLNLAGDLPVYGTFGNVSGKDDNFSLISGSGTTSGLSHGIHIGSPTGLDSADFVRVQGANEAAATMSGTISATGEAAVKYEHLNLFAKLSSATAINVNDLRLAVQTQQIKEIDARYGTRPKEFYQAHFGVLTADSRLQIPEFLGAARVLLNVNQVIQTSQTDSSTGSAQGNQSAYSQTQSKGHLFTKSFTEHGFVMVVGGVRVVGRSYSQGVEKKWFKKSRFDYYLPELAHIGEQPIRNREIYWHDENEAGALSNNGVFGYQQAWYEYRYTPNMVTGLLRPTATGTLAYWNFSENFSETPTLSPKFICEDRTLIDRCLAFPSTNPETGKYTGVDQFLSEFWWENKVTRPMPVSSAPGLLDHSGRILL